MFTGANDKEFAPKERQEEMNFTSKYDVIESLMKTYDEVDRLSAEVERLKRVNADMKSIDSVDDEEDPRAYQKDRIMERGRKEIMKDALSYWDSVKVSRGEEGQLVVQEFADWRKERVDKVPEFLSREDFYVLMDAELRETYDLRKREAIDKLVESERKEEEDVD